ncbi:hypothetical protein ACIGO9_29980 [Nocardia asteroides]|uniref:hypothetical protein n=1 Tax=Nocardia asteroides TaxID=1824 RepID=UPI0037C4F06C
MTDPSLAGFGVEPSDLEALLSGLMGCISLDDELDLYAYLSSRQALLSAAVETVAARRRATVYNLYVDLGEDRSYARVAALIGLTRARVQQMIEQHRAETTASR